MYDELRDLAGMNNAALKSVCRDWGISGYSKMNREALKQAILNHPNNKGENPNG
jgi:hypothetical protein